MERKSFGNLAWDFRKNFKGMVFILTTCKNIKEAEKIGRVLLQKRLAACVLIIPGIVSAYRWIKTLKSKAAIVEREVGRLHSYKVPFVGRISLDKINKEYFQWLTQEVK